jgi:enoyl-CoA hydratase/carnithine racemase
MIMSSVRYKQEGRIVTLTLNRPDTRNALSADVVKALVSGLETANADPSASCVVLHGAGKGFSSGGNLKEIRDLTTVEKLRGAELENWYREGIQQIPAAFHKIDVPVIGAIHGHAVGAGCDLAAMCDIRIAATDAFFAESFVRLGLISGDGGAWYLPRAVGIGRAKEMLLTGLPIDAAKAREWGLVSSVVAPDDLLTEAMKLAGHIASLPPAAVRATKALLRTVEHAGCADVLNQSAKFQAQLQVHPDHLEAIDAVMEKREPNYSRG